MSQAEQKNYDLLITGVGGQGQSLPQTLSGKLQLQQGYQCGLQRLMAWPSVEARCKPYPNWGGRLRVHDPKGCRSHACLEPMEAVRYLEFLKDGGIIIVNTQPVVPVTVTSGLAEYPEVLDILKVLSENT